MLLTLLALPALWPLAGPGLARTNDGLTHLYRAVHLDALLRAGVFFPRWAPDLVHGYGYPVFNFFPYLAHYLIAALHGLGLNFLTAYNAAAGLTLLASAWFAFRLGREHFGETAGLVAGVAYAYSPYLLYDTYIRGSLPENLALALLPLVFLYLRRAAQGDRRASAFAALALAGAIVAHHGVMLQAMPILVAYGLWAWDDGRRRTKDESDGRRPTAGERDDRRQTTDDGNWKLEAGSWTKDRYARRRTKNERDDGWQTTDDGPLEQAGEAAPVLLARQRTTHHAPRDGAPQEEAGRRVAPRVIALGAAASAAPTHPHTRTRTSILPYLLTFTLAFLLSAFFTLPALLEAGYVQVARGTGNGGMSYVDNFLSLRELLALPRLPVDPGLLNPPVVRSLPLAALLIAAVTGLRWLYQRLVPGAGLGYSPAHTRALVFFAAAAVAATLFILPITRPLWDTLPLLRLTLFPWRLLGPISLLVSLAAGAAVVEQGTEGNKGNKGNKTFVVRPASFVVRRSSFVAGFILQPPAPLFPAGSAFILLILFGLPFATPPREAVPAAPSLADVARFEVPPDFIGTTTVGEYLPVWVRELPDTAPHRDQLFAGQPVARHEAPGAAVEVIASGASGATYRIEAPAGVTFRYRTFYFPGWRATLNGRPAPITVTHPHGLMTVAVPPGTHTLRLHFGATPARVAGTALTALGLIGTLALLVSAGSQETKRTEAVVVRPSSVVSSAFILLGLALTLALARPLLYDAGRTPLLQRGPRPALPLNHDFATELTLLGAEAAATALPADDELRVDLYWVANHPLGIPYGFDVRLVDAAGHTWSEDPRRPRDWRFTPGTDFWPTDQYILDPYVLQPIPGTPPGVYSVRVDVFAVPTLQSVGTLNVLDVTVTRPSRLRPCPTGDLPVSGAAWDGAMLNTVRFSTDSAAPGDDVVVSPCWQATPSGAEEAPRAALSAELRLLDGQGDVAASQPFTPGGLYPAKDWQPGDYVRDQVDVRLPAALETGEYTWALSVNGTPAINLGTLAVTAPEREFVAPDVNTLLGANLGPLSLHGLSVPRAGVTRGVDLPLTLVWAANSPLPESYHVFVHLLAPDGSLAAQSDGVPANWTRRTTGWLPGEYVVDERTLFIRPDLPAGTYTLWAGVYLPANGQRLVTEEFPEGRVVLGEVVVE